MIAMASQITNLSIVYSTVYLGTDERKHQSSASLAFVRGIHRWPVNSPHKGPVTRKMFPFAGVIMCVKMFNIVACDMSKCIFDMIFNWKLEDNADTLAQRHTLGKIAIEMVIPDYTGNWSSKYHISHFYSS